MSDEATPGQRRPVSEVDTRIARWRRGHPGAATFARGTSWLLLTVISPTFRVAACMKPKAGGERSVLIVKLNILYLATALLTAGITVSIWNDAGVLRSIAFPLRVSWAWFLWSRCAEVLIAFYRDAMDQLTGKPAGSDLTAAWRVRLALNSYVELIVDYALLYALLPTEMWCPAPSRISEALWISASTITTSGNAGFVPASPLVQFLMACEIVGGVILLVVCFALYSGGKANDRRREDAGSQA